ncbi:type I DNA topoisomerase [Mucisphaera calidilacus]|uniref:DNA topoisomerase 1 n=1 Tax=Mucisphaera calidilacus TaxID=2527982 RepID=A0A518BZT2_9BACT|nr:type I DNA topoisomerase [Mucisphaera calidilacus]QDU72487.1 DNA topoisomerase 1 [Mucisphaera calidilacus]
MAKKKTTKKKTGGAASKGRRSQSIKVADAKGKHLVIVESPTKAKTINKYLGSDYLVMASVGHVRDLPSRNPKGVKNPVPGVNLEQQFEPTYEILPDKKKTVSELKKAAKYADDVWFATDLDREGEAIAWHLAHALDIDLEGAKRVVFNAITKTEIERAFHHPRPIDENRVNAQQARRIVDRIVGYQVSPLLWKKVAGGLSAGRVQSVAVRLVVEREREIDAFIPDESWRLGALMATDPSEAPKLGELWQAFLDGATENGRTVKEQNAWLSEHAVLRAELVGIDDADVKNADEQQILDVAKRLGYELEKLDVVEDPKGKGPAKQLKTAIGVVSASPPDYAIESIATKRTTSKPGAPFITSSLQQAAANRYSFALQRTMRVAQQLYEGIDLGGARGQTGLITYMRTDSTHLAPEAIAAARDHIGSAYGDDYLPEKPNYYSSSNKSAQEAHEAIRPTDVTVRPSDIRGKLNEDQFKLYDLIWKRFVSCQMTPAKWDATTVSIRADLNPGSAKLRASGRKLVFDGFYRVTGVPQSDDVILPELSEGQKVAPLDIKPTQHFTAPPPRYTEASLQKKLEEEGIGRPSTYAAIIQTIQDRKYVEPLMPRDRRLCATDLGMVVTDMLIEAFPEILNVAYTREMESQLDHIEDERNDWHQMVAAFYEPFAVQLEKAHEELTHAKAVTEPAPHKCEQCGADTVYRFGKNGRFLSCSRYPDCKYAAPIDREGNPQSPEMTDILCPEDGKPMIRRTGRFGPFLAASTYPEVKFILKLDPKKGHVVLPKTPPMLTGITCPKCEERELYLRESKRGPWLSCSGFPKCRGRAAWSSLDEEKQAELEKKWAEHQKENPVPEIRTASGRVLKEGDDYIPEIAGSEEPAGSVVARDDAA